MRWKAKFSCYAELESHIEHRNARRQNQDNPNEGRDSEVCAESNPFVLVFDHFGDALKKERLDVVAVFLRQRLCSRPEHGCKSRCASLLSAAAASGSPLLNGTKVRSSPSRSKRFVRFRTSRSRPCVDVASCQPMWIGLRSCCDFAL